MFSHYHKIYAPFDRDTARDRYVNEEKWMSPEIEMLKDLEWEWTEKVDGTNVAIYWDGHTVTYHGRSKITNMPPFLLMKLEEIFGTSEMESKLESMFGEKEAILYGEGYGNKIQGNGGKYIPDDVDFILFDVRVGGRYLGTDNVTDVAQKLGLKQTPLVASCTIEEAVAFIRTRPQSFIGDLPMEGIVGRLPRTLYDNRGNRIITKVKWKDYMPK